jgi:hypothetical protein
MSCTEFRDLLGDHLGGELVIEVRESFDTHRSECEHCGNYLESYTHTVKITRKLSKPGPLPPGLETRLREVLKDHLGGAG